MTKHLKNYIYLDKGYHAGVSEPLYKQVLENNSVIVNLDEEGAVDFSDNSTLKERYSSELFEYANTIFLWGFEQQKLIKQQTEKSDQTIVTGHPRFELLKPEFHFLYNQDVENIVQKHGSFVLVNTNMGFGNNIKGDDFVIANYGNRFENIRKIVKFDKVKLKAYLELIKALSKEIDRKIILRPHPEEDLHYYINAFEDIDSIEVVYSGSVVPWLLAADEVIHPDCTTAIESSFLGKLPISYMPNNSPDDIVTKIPLEISLRFNHISQVVDHLLNKNNHLGDKNTRSKVLDDYFAYRQPTSQLIVNRFKDIRQAMVTSDNQKYLCKQFVFLKIKESINSLRSNNDIYFVRKKLQGFDYGNIKKIQNLLSENGVLPKVMLKKYNKGLFLFKKQ